MQYQHQLKFVIYAHGSILRSSIPIKMTNMNLGLQIASTINNNTQKSSIQLNKLTIGDILSYIKNENHNKFEPPLIYSWPQQLTQYQVFNRSVNSSLFNQRLNLHNLIIESFTQKSTQRNSILVELYIQWPIEMLTLTFMDIFGMRYKVIDSAMTLKQIIRNFSSTLAQTLKMSNPISFVAHYAQSQINQNMKYCDFKHLITSLSPLRISLSLEENNQFQHILQKYIGKQDNNIFICPIRYQYMNSPCIVEPCGHLFEEIHIRIAIFKFGACPICKTKATLENLENSHFLRETIQFIKDQHAFRDEIVSIKANYFKQEYPNY